MQARSVRLASLSLVSGLLLAGLVHARPPARVGRIGKCVDVAADTTAASTLLNALAPSCGADPLTTGRLNVDFKITPAERVVVALIGAQPLNLYEVYWVPSTAKALADAKLVGQVATDCNGEAIDKRVRPIAKGADIGTSAPPQMPTITGAAHGSGIFLAYSRGPYGHDTNSDCRADNYNTTSSPTDPSASTPLANPAVTLSTMAQFVSKNTVSY